MSTKITKVLFILVTTLVLISVLVPNSAMNDKNQSSRKDQKDHSGTIYPGADNSTESSENETTDDETTEPPETSETTDPETSDTSDHEDSDTTSHQDSETTDQETSEHDEDEAKFEVEVKSEKESAEIKSKVERAGMTEEFESSVDFSSEPVIEIKYKSGSDLQEIESELQLKIPSLVEFVDTDLNGKFTVSDTVIQEFNLDQIGFNDLSYTQVDLGNGVIDNVIEAMTLDGIFLIRFHIVGNFTTVNSVDLKPTALKIDFEIRNVPFTSNESKIAILTALESSFEIEKNDTESVVLNSQNPAYFSWLSFADIDGKNESVYSTVDQESNNKFDVVFSYPRGNVIVHDPELGVRPSLVYGELPPTQTTSSVSVPYLDQVLPQTENLVPSASVSSTIPPLIISTLIFFFFSILLRRRE